MLLWDAAIEEPCFAISLRFWHAWRERLARPDQRRLYRKSLHWSQSRLLFPGPNGAPLSRAALHNALRRLNAGGERNSIGPITPEKIRAAFLWGDLLSEGSGSSANSPSVPRRSISRLSRREASLLVLSKKGSSFAIPRISSGETNHPSSSVSAGMSVWDRKPRASRADGVGRQKFNSLDGSQSQAKT